MRQAYSSSSCSFSDTSEENDHFEDLMQRMGGQHQIIEHRKNQKVKRPLPASTVVSNSDNKLEEESKEKRIDKSPNPHAERKFAIKG